MSPTRPIIVSLTGSQPVAASPGTRARGKPIHIETNGFVLRSLVPEDVTPRFLEWLSESGMMRGLNLAGLGYTVAQFRDFVASFDDRSHYIVGIFDQASNLLVGFYTMDVGLTHKVGQITTGVGEAAYDGKKTLWATIDALLDHFFEQRDVDKVSARVLANNYRMLFVFKDNPRFILEGRLLQECLLPSGARVDILVFSSFKNPPLGAP